MTNKDNNLLKAPGDVHAMTNPSNIIENKNTNDT